jgi:two-component system sensor histidine kinase UhpB
MLARLVADFSGRALEVRFDWHEPGQQSSGSLPAVLALALYRISQEALTNVARHAQARVARLRIVFEHDTRGRATALLWSIEDDGVGLTAGGAGAAGQGTGLAGMRERLLALGSELVVAAGRSGRGTRLATRVLLAVAT